MMSTMMEVMVLVEASIWPCNHDPGDGGGVTYAREIAEIHPPTYLDT